MRPAPRFAFRAVAVRRGGPTRCPGRPLAELLGAELVALPGGHFVPLDCPAEVAAAVVRFLAQLR
jgi:pimeloyl-ACP methyl ester carboxylesterase